MTGIIRARRVNPFLMKSKFQLFLRVLSQGGTKKCQDSYLFVRALIG